VRAARLGTYYVDEDIFGLPCSTWISLTEETYSFTGFGYTFNGWPNGLPLVDQEQCVVDMLKITLSEIIKASKDGPTK